jgi:hypothetical protein
VKRGTSFLVQEAAPESAVGVKAGIMPRIYSSMEWESPTFALIMAADFYPSGSFLPSTIQWVGI